LKNGVQDLIQKGLVSREDGLAFLKFSLTFPAVANLRLPPGRPLFQHIEPTGFKQVL
jgi:hypothetical protein